MGKMSPIQEIKNEEIILVNVLKWLFLSVVAGALTGGLIAGFLILLQICIRYVSGLPDWRYALIPAGLLASIYSIRLIAPAAEGHGTDKVISAIHYRAARIPFLVVPAKILSTIFTLAPGGVVGTEGPSVQIGAGFTSALAVWLKFSEKERKKLVVCGVSAALSAVLGAPIGGAIFGVEVLFVGDFFYPVLLPAVISSISSYFVCVALSVSYAVPAVAIPPLSLAVFSWCIMAAVFFSFVCIYHVETVHFICSRFQKVKIPLPVKSFIASGILLCTAAVWGICFGNGGRRFDAYSVRAEPAVVCFFAEIRFAGRYFIGRRVRRRSDPDVLYRGGGRQPVCRSFRAGYRFFRRAGVCRLCRRCCQYAFGRNVHGC